MLSLSGSDTLAHYQSVLDSVTFASSSANPTSYGTDASRTVSWVVNDGTLNSVAATTTVNITAVDNAPVISNVGGSVSTNQNTAVLLAAPSGTVSDVDAAPGDLLLATLSVAHGTLAANGSVPGLTIVNGDDGSTGVLSFTGTQAAITQAIETGVIYTPALNYNGADTLTFSVNDQGHTGSGGPLSTFASVGITVSSDQAPVISNAGNTIGYTELQAVAPALDAALSVSDADNTTLASAAVSITGGFLAGDTLAATTAGTAITASYNAATGVLSLSGSDTLAHYQSVLDSVTFASSSANPTSYGTDASRTVSWVVNDGTLNSVAATTTVNITAVDNAPVISNVGGSVSTNQNTAVLLAAPSGTVSDVDAAPGDLLLATLSVAHGTLAANGSVPGLTIVNGDDGSTGVLSFTGTQAAITQAIETGVIYTPALNYNGADTLTFSVNDQGHTGSGGPQSATATVGITVASGTIIIENGQTLTLHGAIDNTGSISVDSTGDATYLYADASNPTLSGGGTITLADNANSIISSQVVGATLTNVDNTISGAGRIVGDIVHGYITLALINEQKGVIDATGSNALLVSLNSFTNDGLLEATNPNALVNPGGLIINGTTVDGSGGGTVAASGSHVDLQNATLLGGTLTTAAGGVIDTVSGSYNNVFDGTSSAVNNTGSVVITDGSSLTLRGAIDNTGAISVNSTGDATYLYADASNATLSGGGTITLADNANSIISSQVVGATLTNVDNTISGAGRIVGDIVHGYITLALINEQKGVIDATGSNALLVSLNSFTNDGLLEATNPNALVNPGGLIINGTTVDGSGGGTVAASGSHVDLQNATLLGGTLTTAAGGVIDTVSGSYNNVFDGTSSAVNNTGSVVITDGSSLTLRGAIDNTGAISVNSTGDATYLYADASNATLSGGGTITLADNANSIISSQVVGATLTNVDNTISGAGRIVGDIVHGYITLALINEKQGIIDQVGNNLLTIDPNSLTNAGMIDAAGVGGITIDTGGASVTNTGTMEATGVGGLLIQNTTVNNAGGLIVANGGGVNLQSTIITGGTLEAAGSTLFADAGSVVTGAVMITSGGLADFADVFDQNVTFTGAGTLELAHSSSYGATVSGFVSGDKIDLTDLAYASNETAVWTQASGTLQNLQRRYSGRNASPRWHL